MSKPNSKEVDINTTNDVINHLLNIQRNGFFEDYSVGYLINKLSSNNDLEKQEYLKIVQDLVKNYKANQQQTEENEENDDNDSKRDVLDKINEEVPSVLIDNNNDKGIIATRIIEKCLNTLTQVDPTAWLRHLKYTFPYSYLQLFSNIDIDSKDVDIYLQLNIDITPDDLRPYLFLKPYLLNDADLNDADNIKSNIISEKIINDITVQKAKNEIIEIMKKLYQSLAIVEIDLESNNNYSQDNKLSNIEKISDSQIIKQSNNNNYSQDNKLSNIEEISDSQIIKQFNNTIEDISQHFKGLLDELDIVTWLKYLSVKYKGIYRQLGIDITTYDLKHKGNVTMIPKIKNDTKVQKAKNEILEKFNQTVKTAKSFAECCYNAELQNNDIISIIRDTYPDVLSYAIQDIQVSKDNNMSLQIVGNSDSIFSNENETGDVT